MFGMQIRADCVHAYVIYIRTCFKGLADFWGKSKMSILLTPSSRMKWKCCRGMKSWEWNLENTCSTGMGSKVWWSHVDQLLWIRRNVTVTLSAAFKSHIHTHSDTVGSLCNIIPEESTLCIYILCVWIGGSPVHTYWLLQTCKCVTTKCRLTSCSQCFSIVLCRLSSLQSAC